MSGNRNEARLEELLDLAEIPFERLSETSRRAIAAKKTVLLDYELPHTPALDRQTHLWLSLAMGQKKGRYLAFILLAD